MSVLILTDSRGQYLQGYLPESDELKYHVIHQGGANFNTLADLAVLNAHHYKPDYIVIFGGLCNITIRYKKTKYTELRDHPTSIQDNFPDAMLNLSMKIGVVTNVPVMFCPVVGVDLKRYSHIDHYHPHQDMLNDLVVDLNQYITSVNAYHGVPTPWIATQYHKYNGPGNISHRYGWLEDGCHFESDALINVAFELNAAVKKLHRAVCIGRQYYY